MKVGAVISRTTDARLPDADSRSCLEAAYARGLADGGAAVRWSVWSRGPGQDRTPDGQAHPADQRTPASERFGALPHSHALRQGP